MAAGDGIEQVTYGTGASGLAPASITYGSINTAPLLTAMQQRMRNIQNARENEIALQQLASREQIAQAEMQLKRDQFAAEAPLRDAQIENYKALANYHNKMGQATSDAITKQWQYDAALAPQLATYNQDMLDLNNQVEQGSDDWWLGKNAIENKHAQLLATDPGMKAQNMWDNRGQRASVAIAQGQLRTAKSLDDVATKYSVPMSALSDLQQSVDTPIQDIPASGGGFQASAGGAVGNIWGTNTDGSRFAYQQLDPNGKVDPKIGLTPLSDYNSLPTDDQKNYRKVTIQAPQVDSIVAASRALSGPLRGNGVAPNWAYSLRGRAAGQAQQRVRRYNPATQKYESVSP